MEKEKAKIRSWIKRHAKELIIAGVSVSVIVGFIMGYKDLEELDNVSLILRRLVAKRSNAIPVDNNSFINVTNNDDSVILHESVDIEDIADNLETSVVIDAVAEIEKISYEVSKHIRNLPEGYNASPEKIASAVENGFVLQDGQTWVKTYNTGGNAA